MSDEDNSQGQSNDQSVARVSMTQEDFEARMTARSEQAVRAAERAIIDALGGKPDEVAAELQELRELRKAGLDATEKAKVEAAEKAAEAERKLAALEARERDIQIRAALLTPQGDETPVSTPSLDDAVALVVTAVSGGEDIPSAIAALRERQPAMFGSSRSNNSSNGSQGNGAPAAKRSVISRHSSGDDDPHAIGKALAEHGGSIAAGDDFVRPLDRT